MNEAEIFEKYNDVINSNQERTKPPIPELPEKNEDLKELAAKKFDFLQEGKPIPRLGHAYLIKLLLRCPFCKMEFDGIRKKECFTDVIFPHTCPNCNFPNRVFEALRIWQKDKRK